MRRGILDKGSGKRTEEFMNVIQDLIRKESPSTQIGAELANLKQTYNTLVNATKTYHSTNWVQLQLLTADARRNLIQRFVEYPVPADYASMSLPDRRAYFDGILFERITVSRQKVCALEIWCECFGCDPARITHADAIEINRVLENTPGWKRVSNPFRFGCYGRQGQKEKVVIHHLICTGTRDENIAQALAKKDMTQEYVLASLKARINQSGV